MAKFPSPMAALKRLRGDVSGISLVEFALVLPIILTLGLYGTEVARMANTKMKVSQIALSLADNASRLGQTDNSGVTPTINEDEVDALLRSALQQGESIDIETNARIILTSLEYHDPSDKQFIAWQRCIGDYEAESQYGNDSAKNGLAGKSISGLGSGKKKITSTSNQAVMFVEITYQYQSLWDNPFGSGDGLFYEEAAFLVRDDRNLDRGLTGATKKNECISAAPAP